MRRHTKKTSYLPLHFISMMNHELYESYRSRETKFPTKLMKNQSELNCKMRVILIDWIIEVSHTVFDLTDDERLAVLFQTVMILDKYTEKAYISRSDYQLVGAICMRIAFKYECGLLLTINRVIHLTCRHKDDRKLILDKEMSILEELDYSISFINSYMLLITLFECDESDSVVRVAALKLLERLLVKHQMAVYNPSIVACSVLLMINIHYNKEQWSTKLRKMTKYKLKRLEKCKDMIQGLVDLKQIMKIN